MNLLKSIFKRIWRLFPHAPSRPEDIPKKLSSESLQKAMQEAKFLHSGHAVSVQPLAEGELPGLPKKAED